MSRWLHRFAIWMPLACCTVIHGAVDVTVDWNSPRGMTPSSGYGTNIFTGLDPAISAKPAYTDALKTLGVALIRLHANSMVRAGDDKSWVKADGVTWDARKIAAVFDNLAPLHAQVIVNIPGWPRAWCAPGTEMLDPVRYDDFARFCAQLVDIVNNEQKRGVVLWENINEREVKFLADQAGMGAYGEIFRRSAVAMREISRTPIKISPAWMNLSQQVRLELFLNTPGVRDNLGFFAFHQYATPRATDLDGSGDRNQHLFNRAAEIASGVKKLRAYLDGQGLDRLELVYDEYHLAATYDIDAARHLMHGPEGMIFFALLHKYIVEGGTNALLLSWNERDGAYGLMDLEHRLRPTGALVQLSNRYLRGACFSAESSEPSQVESFAIRSSPRARAILVINRNPAVSSVRLSMAGWQPDQRSWHECRLLADKAPGVRREWDPNSPAEMTLAPYGATLCLFGDSP